MTPITRTLAFLGPFFVFFAAMLWATDAPFRTQLTADLSTSFIVLAEHTVNLLFVLPILFFNWRELKNFTKREWIAVIVIAVGGSALASMAFTQSFKYVNPSVAILLQKVQPLIAISLAALFLKEQMHKYFWIWAVIAMAGAYLISFPNIVPQMYEGEVFNPNTLGVLFALLAAVLWGASTVLGKYALRVSSFQMLTALRFGIAFLFLLTLAITQDNLPPFASVSSTDWLYIAIVALVSGVFSISIYYYGLQFTKASIATLAELGFPLAAVFVNAYFIAGNNAAGTYFGLFLGQWAGTALLLFALYMLGRENREEVVVA
ncbi:MAG: DMT family transporter [Candidatus Pacebacteria bacterium]|nr:DMT family transporter [Candidatus Paceibacterota bacterium]